MQPTNFQTLTVEPVGSETPTVLAKANEFPTRTQVSNVGPVVLFVADDVNNLVPAPTMATYRIIPGEQHVLVLASRQSLYGVGAGTGGMASVSNSEALPSDHQA